MTFKDAKVIFYGNTYTGEICECKLLETHDVRGGTQFITDKGEFLVAGNTSQVYFGDTIFGTDKKQIIKTMNEYIWGMSDEAIARFHEQENIN